MKVTIGPHGAISPATARASKDLSGRDLRDAKAPTVAEPGRRFLDEYVTDHCKPNTKRQYRKMVEGYILPRLGTRRVPDVQRIDVASLHHDMRATPTNANRMLATLSRMFAAAELWQMRPDGSNPCRNIKHFREERRERFLSDEEYRRLGEILREVEREGSERQSAIAAIRLLMLTGCRKGEILTLRWDDVDRTAGEFRLRDGKRGPRMVPLTTPVLKVLDGIERIEANPWVIRSKKPGIHLPDLTYYWNRIQAHAGLEGCASTTFATAMLRARWPSARA